MSGEAEFSLKLEHMGGFEFEARFDLADVKPLTLDEPKPLGKARGPNASRLLGAAVGYCLSASLLFCLEKFRFEVTSITTDVRGRIKRLDKGRLRVASLDVDITLDVGEDLSKRKIKCLQIFEDYCTVTESIKKSIDIRVSVRDVEGNEIFSS